MKFLHAALFLSALCAVAGLAATTPTKTTAKKSTTKVSSTVKATGAKVTSKAAVKAPVSTASATKSSASTAKKSTAPSHVVARSKKATGPPAPRRPTAPTADRYKEIQSALVAKGYLKEDPTGVWDSESVAAMQHFQSDQKQTPNGKITAASLIGLGLGAKSAGAPEAPPLGGHPAAADPGAPPAAAATSGPASQ